MFVAIVVLLFVVGLIIKYIWWIVGAGALVGASVGLYFVGRAVMRQAEEQQAVAERREFELQRRADRQHRWMLSGDSRAVYGQDGVAAMHAVAPEPSLPDGEESTANDDLPVARMATTAAELAALGRDKPQEWQWALFASVLVQRTTPLLPRLRDSELGFMLAGTTPISSVNQLVMILCDLVVEMHSTKDQLEEFMGSPAFRRAVADLNDDSRSDPEAIKHLANRVMDFQDRFLELSERCRGLSVPYECAELLTDCARLLDMPLQGYREFVGELADFVESIPQVLQHATGSVHMGAIVLVIDIDDKLRSRILRRIEKIRRS